MPASLQNSESAMGSLLSQPVPATLKRPRAASAPCENEQERHRKRWRGSDLTQEKITEQDEDDVPHTEASSLKGKGKEKELPPVESHPPPGGTTAAVIEDLAQELKCGCCTELCYNPVIVNPCQHYFCGSCCTLWVRNGGTNCPACRSVSTTVTPSRVLQSMIDLLLRSDPSRGRTASERAQADQVYRAGTSMRLPTPRPATPNLEAANDNLARPCPTCLPGNPYGWRCPVPIPDPVVDSENAFDLDDGTPTGHGFCGNCDQLHNVQAPTSSKCDMCQVSFCGVGIQGRCCALGLLVQQPQDMTELQDLILSPSIYDCFQKNSVEIDILVDYLRVNEISLRAVYKEIIAYTLEKPNGFTPLIDSGVFEDSHPIPGGEDPDPAAPRVKICRPCAAQVLIHGLKDWWIRERHQRDLPAEVLARKDCPQGSLCDKQSDQAHAKELNHILQPPLPPPGSEQVVSAAPSVPPSAAEPSSSNQVHDEQRPLAPSLVNRVFPLLPRGPVTSGSAPAIPREPSQAEVERMTVGDAAAAEGSNAAASTSAGRVLVLPEVPMAPPNAPSAQRMPPNPVPVAGDIMMSEDTVLQPQAGGSMDPEAVLELLRPKTPSSSRAAHVPVALSPNA